MSNANDFFSASRALRFGHVGNANCRHCGEVIFWHPEGGWCLVDAMSMYHAICETRYEKDKAWAVIPELVHEPNVDHPVDLSRTSVEEWLDAD